MQDSKASISKPSRSRTLPSRCIYLEEEQEQEQEEKTEEEAEAPWKEWTDMGNGRGSRKKNHSRKRGANRRVVVG
jgi:hypothetical protein